MQGKISTNAFLFLVQRYIDTGPFTVFMIDTRIKDLRLSLSMLCRQNLRWLNICSHLTRTCGNGAEIFSVMTN